MSEYWKVRAEMAEEKNASLLQTLDAYKDGIAQAHDLITELAHRHSEYRKLSADAMRAEVEESLRISKVAQALEMKLAIWGLAEGFGTLGAIECAQCHTPAHLHELEPGEDGQVEMALYGVDRYYAGRCSNWPAR